MSQPVFERSRPRDRISPLLQDLPSVNLPKLYAPSTLGGLFKGRIESVNKDLSFTVRNINGQTTPIPGRMSFAYCHAPSASGIIAAPEKGAFVLYYEQYEDGLIYANVLTYISGSIAQKDFDFKANQPTPNNPGFELFGSIFDGDTKEKKDQGLVPGDMGIFGRNGNKVKVFNDGSILIRSTASNFTLYTPIDDKVYEWKQNSFIRSPGSYEGSVNIVTSDLLQAGSMHYAIRRHFVSPNEQTTAFQEELGLVDDITRASGGNFEDMPEKEAVQASASIAKGLDPVARLTMQGYSVCRRKIFDFGGRGVAKKPPAAQAEFFCEEYKTDGGYRVHFGTRMPGQPKPAKGVEVYYNADGTWYIGSAFGKIQCGTTDMTLSTANGEISIGQIIDFMKNHVHGYVTPATAASGVPGSTGPADVKFASTLAISNAAVIPETTNLTVSGLNTGYLPITSKIPDPNLIWTP